MKLFEWLEQRQMSGAEFASMIGVSPAAVSRWLNNERIPRLEQMLSIQSATKGKVKPEDFYHGRK